MQVQTGSLSGSMFGYTCWLARGQQRLTVEVFLRRTEAKETMRGVRALMSFIRRPNITLFAKKFFGWQKNYFLLGDEFVY